MDLILKWYIYTKNLKKWVMSKGLIFNQVCFNNQLKIF